MKEISGYKVFDSQMRNMYGQQFEVGETYSVKGKLKFRDDGSNHDTDKFNCNGFHMCKNLEDTFRYIGDKEDYKIAAVTGYGDYIKGDDIINDIDDLYAVRAIKIIKVLKPSEIIEYGLGLELIRKRHFVSWLPFKMNPKEIEIFKLDFYVASDVAYYHEGDTNAYEWKTQNKRTL